MAAKRKGFPKEWKDVAYDDEPLRLELADFVLRTSNDSGSVFARYERWVGLMQAECWSEFEVPLEMIPSTRVDSRNTIHTLLKRERPSTMGRLILRFNARLCEPDQWGPETIDRKNDIRSFFRWLSQQFGFGEVDPHDSAAMYTQMADVQIVDVISRMV